MPTPNSKIQSSKSTKATTSNEKSRQPTTPEKRIKDDAEKYISELRACLEKRLGYCEGILPLDKHDDLNERLTNIISDAKTTIGSMTNYLEKIEHMTDEELANPDFMVLIKNTVKAALLVFDKRFIDTIQEFASREREDMMETLVDYLHQMPPEINHLKIDRNEDHDDDAQHPLPKTHPADKVVFDRMTTINKGLAELGNPYRPKFSQTKAGHQFGEKENIHSAHESIIGNDVAQIGEQIKKGKLSKEIINVGVFFHDNSWVAYNNRSLACASISGIEPRLEIIFPPQSHINHYQDKIHDVETSVLKKYNVQNREKILPKIEPKIRNEIEQGMFSMPFEDDMGKIPAGAVYIKVPEKWMQMPSGREVDELKTTPQDSSTHTKTIVSPGGLGIFGRQQEQRTKEVDSLARERNQPNKKTLDAEQVTGSPVSPKTS